MTRGRLQKFINKYFKGNWVEAANEMVVLFCEKYHIPGSAGYNFYEGVQQVWEKALEEEKERVKEQSKLDKEWLENH